MDSFVVMKLLENFKLFRSSSDFCGTLFTIGYTEKFQFQNLLQQNHTT